MSTGVRRPLLEARRLADEVVQLIEPACERIEIAGSIRRGNPDIGDIEVVCIPRLYRESVVEATDLFGMEIRAVESSSLEARCARLGVEETFRARPNKDGKISVGSKLKWLIYRGFPLDIYICDLDTWAVTMVIRTGPAEFSKRLVTARKYGGLCPSHLHFEGWRIRHRRSGEPLSTPTEESVFEVLGLDYIPPEARGLAMVGVG